MAQNFYVGITRPAGMEITTIDITSSNISTYFTVNNGTYYFKGSGSTFTTTNGGVNSSTATTTLTALQDMDISFSYSYSSEPSYDKFTLTVKGIIIENAVSGATTTKSYSTTLAKNDVISFQYKKDSSANSNDDKCTFYNMKMTGSVAVETKDLAKKIKKCYVGIDNIARNIKKGYVGVNGIAMPFFLKKITHYTTTALSTARTYCGGTAIGGYALYGGGSLDNADSSPYGTVEVFDNSLSKLPSLTLSPARTYIQAASTRDYAIFGDGNRANKYSNKSYYDAYSKDLTRLTPSTYISYNFGGLGTTMVATDDQAIFSPHNSTDSYCFVIKNNLSYTTVTGLKNATSEGAGTKIQDRIIFAGGYYSSTTSSQAECYTEALTKIILDKLQSSRQDLSATSLNNYAIFAGGYSPYIRKVSVDMYNYSLTHSIGPDLSVARDTMGAASFGEYSLFVGGVEQNGNHAKTVEIIDKNFALSLGPSLQTGAARHIGVALQDYVLFAGGHDKNLDATNTVEVFCLSS